MTALLRSWNVVLGVVCSHLLLLDATIQFQVHLLYRLPSVLWHCWLGDREVIWPVKNCGDGGGGLWLVRMKRRPAGWSLCLPLLIFPCTIKSEVLFWHCVVFDAGGPRKRAVKRLWCGVVSLVPVHILEIEHSLLPDHLLLWNSLPTHVHRLDLSLDTFRHKLKRI